MKICKLKAIVFFLSAVVFFSSTSWADETQTSNQPKAKLNDSLLQHTDEASEVDKIPDGVLRELAFELIKQEQFPFTEQQLKELFELKRQQMAATKRRAPPSILSDIISVSTRPGADIPIIYVTPGMDTIINVIDKFGEPWPMQHSSIGSKEDFPIEEIPVGNHNMVKIRSEFIKGTTNLTLILKGLASVITLSIVASDSQYHPQPIIQIDTAGPNAKPQVNRVIGDVKYDIELKGIILGIPPNDSFKKLSSSDPRVEAWIYRGELFYRSQLFPTSPQPRGIHHGPRGWTAYRSRFLPILWFTNLNGVDVEVQLMEMTE